MSKYSDTRAKQYARYEKSTVYTIEIEINRAIYKSKPVKETSVNIPVVPLEFRLDPSVYK